MGSNPIGGTHLNQVRIPMLKLLEILETPDLCRVTRMVEDYMGSRQGLQHTYMSDFIENDKVHIVITNDPKFLECGYRIQVFTDEPTNG